MPNLDNIAAVYIANPEFISELTQEIESIDYQINDLIFSSTLNTTVCIAKDIWLTPKIVQFQSISEAVKILRQAGKFWYHHEVSHSGRAKLIASQLRQYNCLTQPFPIEKAIPAIGGFCLLDQNTLVYSASRLKKWPDGNCLFIEDKINPPNRAYLKLWEAITLLNKTPKPGETAIDLGASPGGWTYVMQSLGTEVTAVDKALLDAKISRLPRVSFMQQSAFALDPAALEKPYDWVLSDIACYPERALALIMKWINSGKAKQMIFTIKLQGQIHLSTLKAFQAIPNSSLIHLHYNKHEVTFFHPGFQL